MRQDVETGGLLAIHDHIDLQPARLFVAGDIGQGRQRAQLRQQPAGPQRELRLVSILKRVLVLSPADAAVDLHILHGLHEQRGAFDVFGGVPQAGNDFAGTGAALVARLETDIKPAAVQGRVDGASPDEGSNRGDIVAAAGPLL